MDSGDFFALTFLIGLGVGLTLAGVLYISGKYKSPYFFTDERQRLVFKMGIGFGSFYFFLGLGVLVAIAFPNSYFSTYNGSAIFVWLALLTPLANILWLALGVKPKWIKWLEKEYPRSISFLGSEARKMGLRKWQAQIRTQVDLEKWVYSFGLQKPKPLPSSLSLPRPPLPPRTFLPMRDEGFKLDDQVIWERHDGQRFLARVVKLSPQRIMIKLVDEDRYTLVKPENIYHI